jgi:hypothetical protein
MNKTQLATATSVHTAAPSHRTRRGSLDTALGRKQAAARCCPRRPPHHSDQGTELITERQSPKRTEQATSSFGSVET